jgi:hypothetical protein
MPANETAKCTARCALDVDNGSNAETTQLLRYALQHSDSMALEIAQASLSRIVAEEDMPAARNALRVMRIIAHLYVTPLTEYFHALSMREYAQRQNTTVNLHGKGNS